MQKHKWLTKWSSLSILNFCLQQNTMKNKEMGKILFFCLAIFTCLCACISNLLWWMFAFRLTGDGRNLRRQLDCSDPLIFIPPTHRSGSLRFPVFLFEKSMFFLFFRGLSSSFGTNVLIVLCRIKLRNSYSCLLW